LREWLLQTTSVNNTGTGSILPNEFTGDGKARVLEPNRAVEFGLHGRRQSAAPNNGLES
jgi:hypothetical protein